MKYLMNHPVFSRYLLLLSIRNWSFLSLSLSVSPLLTLSTSRSFSFSEPGSPLLSLFPRHPYYLLGRKHKRTAMNIMSLCNLAVHATPPREL